MGRTKKILVVGQTPPPYGGQAMMTKRLVDADFKSIQIIHVRLSFSENFRQIGKASWKKIFHMFSVALHVWKQRLKYKQLTLYYMPAGPNRVPVIRDLILLSLVRPFFSKTIYHFRAAGISEYISKQPVFFQRLCKFIYGKPCKAIQLSSLNPKDANFFSAQKVFFIPNGIEDNIHQISSKKMAEAGIENQEVQILFVGVLREDKGLSWLLDSLNLVLKNGISNFKLLVMGEFSSVKYEKEVEEKIVELGLQKHVEFLGVKVSHEKWKYFSTVDFLCFPTFFDCESFGNVLIEAMMFHLPVIASNWRGIPDIVTADVGFLVPVRDNEMLAEKISLLIKDENMRKKMGCNARKKFLENYTLDIYLQQMEAMFSVN
jgi:glycosyltransferase involved in cell wall biosynthesis